MRWRTTVAPGDNVLWGVDGGFLFYQNVNFGGFVAKTRNDYIRHVRAFAAFIGRAPDTTTPEDLRRFQLKQTEDGVGVPQHLVGEDPVQIERDHQRHLLAR